MEKNNENIVRLQVKSGIKDGVGFASVLASDFKFWKKDDPEGVKRMWKQVKVLCCPKDPAYTYDNSNIGFLDQCSQCERVEKCRATIKKHEEMFENED